jgi:hypothetical protein
LLQRRSCGDLSNDIPMADCYLVLPCLRRVIIVEFDNDDHYSIERASGTATVEHGTTFGAPDDQFRVAGVPLEFHGNGSLVGTDPATGDMAERPVMSIHEFTRMISIAASSEDLQVYAVLHAQIDE